MKVKHLEYLSGVSMVNYWVSLMIVDMVKYLIVIFIGYPYMISIDVNYLYIFPIFFAFVISCLLFTYALSFLIHDADSGQMFYFLVSYIGLVVFLVPALYISDEYFLTDRWIFTIGDVFPHSTLASTLMRAVFFIISNTIVEQYSLLNVLANAVIVFFFQGIIYGFLLYIFQANLLQRLIYHVRKQTIIPQDISNVYIQRERENVRANLDLSLKIKDVTMTYKGCCKHGVTAVNCLSLGLEYNEKFGLLGFNGSGKTTIFKMLTDEIYSDTGEIEIMGLNTHNHIEILRHDMGYCPQEQALFNFLTVKETFDYYYSLKERHGGTRTKVSKLLENFGLTKYQDTICCNLSGGNKRKLNFAIALMNNPRIVLLDEPSTGIDPDSRRTMWKNINDIPKKVKNFIMILSTHSMEEAEVLCDKIGWMKNGNFMCIGNPEKLKLDLSQGYCLLVKFKKPRLQHITHINEEMIRKKFGEMSTSIKGFSLSGLINLSAKDGKLCLEHVFYYEKLDMLIQRIILYCNSITITNQQLRNSFELIINVTKEKQNEMLSNLLTLKANDADLVEISITMPSLEAIVTEL